jgi:Peptidase family M23/FlgD Ig-like domain
MKKNFVFVICLLFLPLLGKVNLNEFGHIIEVRSETSADFIYEKGEYFIEIDGKTLIGNSLFEVQNGFLTLTGEHENLPTWLRSYDQEGELLLYKELEKVINLTISENRKYAAFFDGNSLQILDTENTQFNTFGKSIQFAVDNFGNPLFIDERNQIHYKNKIFPFHEMIRSVLFQNEIPCIITKHSIYKIDENIERTSTFSEEIFEVKVIDNKLYLVLKNGSNFALHELVESQQSNVLDEIDFDRESNRTHEPIYAPLNYGEENVPFHIGNSYAEIQQYGYTPYLHPGVDFLGDDYQEVYAVHDGFVKAVLTTGGDPYWRVAIANEDSPDETQGYLYAHLNENSITVNVGDQVQAGDLLGTLYPWGFADFTHIHFARVFCSGQQWIGDWWTTENNLVDVINIQDFIPPIFEDALYEERFAFRNSAGNYLDPLNLNGEFDIIAKCHDIANSAWRIDVHDLSYSLHPHNDPDSTLFQNFAFVYDFDLDTYINSTVDWMILNTIYSRDGTCYSIGDYDEREYYHIITNSNGDSLITADDAAENFDSSQFDDGVYLLKVTARDACLNTTVDSMMVIFNNGVSAGNELPNHKISLSNYPNPFNPSTTISFSISTEIAKKTELVIHNLKGQEIRKYSIFNNQSSIVWDGTDQTGKPVSSGIYFYKLKTNSFEKTNKMILIK